MSASRSWGRQRASRHGATDHLAVVAGANQTFVAAQEISVAFEPGTTVGVRAFRSEAAPEAGQVTGSVHGYLVEV